MQVNGNLAYRLSTSVGASLIGVGAGGTVQNRFSNAKINIKDAPFNAVGNNIADDTAAFQAAVDALIAVGGGEIFAPRGTYNLSQIDYKTGGIAFTGEPGGTTFFKIPSSETFKRMFTRLAPVTAFAVDSQPVSWFGITFDGNSANATGPYRGFQLEHQHMIFMTASDGAGRLRGFVDNCVFKNCVADAISIYTNCNVDVSNCIFADAFRGSVVITGGNSRVRVSNCDAQGGLDKSRVDVEVDGAGTGGSLAVDIEMTNVHSMNGFDFSTSGNSKLVVTNCTSDKTDNTTCTFGNAAGDVHRFNNCLFYLGVADNAANRLIVGNKITFSDCDITYFRPTTTVGVADFGIWIYISTGCTNTKVVFSDCTFNKDSSVNDTDTIWGVRQIPAALSAGHNLTLRDCNIGPTSLFDFGTWTRGNSCNVIDTTINAVCPFQFDNFDLSYIYMEGIRLGPGAIKFGNIVSLGVTLEFNNVVIDESQADITVDFAFIGNRYLGHRTILGTANPTGGDGKLIGDTWALKSPVKNNYNSYMLTGYSGPDSLWTPFNYLGILPGP